MGLKFQPAKYSRILRQRTDVCVTCQPFYNILETLGDEIDLHDSNSCM